MCSTVPLHLSEFFGAWPLSYGLRNFLLAAHAGLSMGLPRPGMASFISLCYERAARGQKMLKSAFLLTGKKQGTVLENDPLHEVCFTGGMT